LNYQFLLINIYKKSGHLPGFFDRGIYPWERNAFCQGFTPGKVETRAFDILMICQGYNPWETRRRENNIVEREKI
jgi:hypothetical protein